MKSLFLTSSFAEVSELFVKTTNNKLEGKRVTFIPTASINEEITFYVDAGKEALESQGLIIDVLEISTAKEDEIISKINSNDFIYISGGNTFFLLQELKRTGTDRIIKGQINAGKPFIGESAGSIVLSPNIEYIKEMDDYASFSLESYDALNLINFYPLPHYNDFPFQECTEKIVNEFDKKVTLVPFNNTQAIVVSGEEYKLITT
ncbi:MAG: Type 1 glutamine amidotransferase-like domain-containing protein [Sedimenticola sp.]|nr:Type 1 glutamine amidotransferase-like domain-containing protein [Sedimenticola sp.]